MSVENPPGWHPDPVGRHEHRYWDGIQWTDHVADQGRMATDPLQAAPPQEKAPIGPSMVNLPAINPADLQVSIAQPVSSEPTPAAAQPTPAAAGPEPTADYAAAGDTAVGPAPAADVHPGTEERPASLALMLSIIAPGAGHLWLNARREIAFGLLGATAVAVILMWFISYPLGLIVYLAALAYALFDLRGVVMPVLNGGVSSLADVGSPLAWRIVGAGGVLTAIGLVLPWYRIKTDISIAGRSQSASTSASGFDAFDGLDMLLLVIGIAAIVLAAIHITQSTTARGLPPAVPLLAAIAGGIAWVLVVYRLLSVPGAAEATSAIENLGGASVDLKIGRGIGALIDYGGTFAILFGSLAAMASARRAR
jgi:hypothetical protein